MEHITTNRATGATMRINHDNDGYLECEGMKTIGRYKELKEEWDNRKLSLFYAFNNQQFEEGKEELRKKGLYEEGEKIYSLGAGAYSTKKGLDIFFGELEEHNRRIRTECDPQEVYWFEYNNHESFISWDGDDEPMRIIISIWGSKAAGSIRRLHAMHTIGQLKND